MSLLVSSFLVTKRWRKCTLAQCLFLDIGAPLNGLLNSIQWIETDRYWTSCPKMIFVNYVKHGVSIHFLSMLNVKGAVLYEMYPENDKEIPKMLQLQLQSRKVYWLKTWYKLSQYQRHQPHSKYAIPYAVYPSMYCWFTCCVTRQLLLAIYTHFQHKFVRDKNTYKNDK